MTRTTTGTIRPAAGARRVRGLLAWGLLAGSLLAACQATSGTPGGVAGGTGSAGAEGEPGPGFHRAPTIDGSRAACLLPPFGLPPELTSLPDGSLVERLGDGRAWNVKLAGDRETTHEESMALLERLRAADESWRFLGYGVYCGTPAHLCFRIDGNLCELRVEDAITRFREAVARDGQLAGARLELQVALEGNLGPRCTAEDPSCVPIPYEGHPRYDAGGARRAGPLRTHGGGSCAHDGECVVGGCGNHCMHWTFGGAHEGATCEGYDLPERTFCGCVEGACGWFTQ